ncbi:hypothetical protein [Brochothrix phage ADU4]|uniref:Gp78 n=1 Tax=Brochothrix phage A9 TaxID=857312 RepID=D9J0M5_9CAUD|nr:gp78 [Brochothrix phage A9]ADJ53118.1 gp78 [Brochothrix phage A9]UKM96401.1 hypothetical protein [Brochothrix phage ADU4]
MKKYEFEIFVTETLSFKHVPKATMSYNPVSYMDAFLVGAGNASLECTGSGDKPVRVNYRNVLFYSYKEIA